MDPQVRHYVGGGVHDTVRGGCGCFCVASSGGFVLGGYHGDDAPFPAGKEPLRTVVDTLRTHIMQLTGKGKVHLSVRAKESVDRGERVGEQGILYFQI